MSRKRDTNWSRDEITVLLDSIIEITRSRDEGGKRTTSREIFEYAAKKLGEKGHACRAEREKCRTKWKKMKEEFTHAKRAREGDARYKEAPGIHPFYDRMEEFINGNFDNISPQSTIVRRSSSISSASRASPGGNGNGANISGMRTSARIAANINGTSSNDNNTDTTCSTIETKTTGDYGPLTISSLPSNQNSLFASRQNSRLSSGGNNNNSTTTTTMLPSSNNNNNTNNMLITHTQHQQQSHQNNPSHQQQQQQQNRPHAALPQNGLCTIFNQNNTSSNLNNSNGSLMNSSNGSNNNNDPMQAQPAEQADISYRVSTGCRQITIFGDHDVDIKFRGDCVTINKIDNDCSATET